MRKLVRWLKGLLVCLILLAAIGLWLWHSGNARSFLVRTPWARQLVERFASSTLDVHHRSLGTLGYYRGATWQPLPDNALSDSLWIGQLLPLAPCDSIDTGVCASKLALRHENGVPFELVIIAVDPSAAEVRVLVNDESTQSKAFVDEMAKRAHAVAAINAGFFDENGALGLVLQESHELRPANRASSFLVVKDGTVHIRKDSLSGAVEGIQSGPLLLIDGKPYGDAGQRANETEIARRSAAAVSKGGRLLLTSTNADVGGLTIAQLAAVLRGLDAQHALALDGGGSTQLYVRNKNYSVSGWDRVPVALGVFPRSRTR